MLERGQEVLVDAARLLIPRRLLGCLRLKPGPLVHRVRQLRKGVGELAADRKELEPLRHARSGPVRLGQRRHLGRMVEDEGRLHQLWLAELLEAQREQLAQRGRLAGAGHASGLRGRAGRREPLSARGGVGAAVRLAQRKEVELRQLLRDELRHGDAAPRRREVDGGALVLDGSPSRHVPRRAGDELLGEGHHVLVVGVGLVELDRGELWVVPRRDALVAEDAAELVDTLHAADDEALEVELRRDPQREVEAEGVVVRLERLRLCAARLRVEARRLDLEEAALVEVPPEVGRDARARGEGGAHARVDDHVEVALPVPLVDVGQPLPLVG
mmetsp:Transcript_33070/g.103929  ORF Transcript_33070/g.103929 Transcript_33070/m.103929 type:complete len:329 (-) Transcript_33070:921-1907(-)